MRGANSTKRASNSEIERLKAMRTARNIERFGFGLGALKSRVEWPLVSVRPSRRDA